MKGRFRFPSPATGIATIALFVALSGTAVAAGIVAKAKFALNAGGPDIQGVTLQTAPSSGPRAGKAFVVTRSA